ncbi:MAG: elongation factor G [Candidatus Bipolaricaulis sp.]|nr:elongation factor G [Candidatus Bipolaricaulis sp.]
MGQARTICLVGHSSCGKTALASALLTRAGSKEQITLDASQEEKERGHTLDMGFGAFQTDGATITLLDTPGGDEFVEEMYKGIPVADLVLLVVNAEKAVEVVTERAWDLSAGAQRPTIVLVNQMDKENADFEKAVADLRSRFDAKLVPIQMPIRTGGSFTGIVDLVSNRLVHFAEKAKKEIPGDLVEEVEAARNALLEEVSTADDELMMKFLDEAPISESEITRALVQGVASGAVVPVLCSSVTEGKGLDQLTKALVAYVAPKVGDPSAPCRVVAFNLASDPYLGRLSFVRVLEGTIQEGKGLVDVVSGAKVDVRDLYALEGTKQKRVPQAGPGEIVAIAKAEHILLGATLGLTQGGDVFSMLEFPRPVFSRTIVPKSQADVDKMGAALKEIAATKATIIVERDPVTKELTLHGMGDVHLSVFIERLKNRYNVSLETRQPRIPYKETIRKKAEAKYRHKKQTGGRGQFGEVYLRLEPYKGEGGFKFVDEIKGAAIPGQYVPGVEKGVLEAIEQGSLAKFPVTDVLVAVFDGSFHPVDSSELAFKLAARGAFREAFDNAEPCLLEPIMAVRVRVPEEYMGDIISDMNGRRGRILGMEPAGTTTVIVAEAPLAELLNYALDLKSRTQGRATFSMDFARYQQVPGNIQEKVVAQAQTEQE